MPYEALIVATEPLIPRMLERVMERRDGTPLTVQQTDGGGAISICHDDGTPVLTVYAPQRFEFDDELRRIFPGVAERVRLPAFVHEVLIGRDDAELGEALGSAAARTIDAQFLPLVS